MFSTVKTTSVSSPILASPASKSRAYSRCQRNGGGRTTTRAPSRSATSLDRMSLPHGSRPQTRWGSSRDGPGAHGTLVIIAQPAQDVHVLAHRVGVDHGLHAGVAEPGGGLERVRRAVRIDRTGGQRDRYARPPGGLAQRFSLVISAVSPTGASLCRTMASAAQRRVSDPAASVRVMAKSSTGSPAAAAYRCSQCDWRTAKWAGRCGECQAWGTVAEVPAVAHTGLRSFGAGPVSTPAIPIGQVDATAALARPTGLGELDRVLGGGLVPGAVLLLTGEESAGQVRLRADRIGAVHANLYLA